MKYYQLRIILDHHSNKFNSATGTGNDDTVDTNINTDPNNYLVPRADSANIIQYLIIIALVIGIIFLFTGTLKNTKAL